MWRAVVCLCAALILGAPQLSHAQYADNDQQNPQEYTQEDSHPLRVVAYILAPIGFVLEWCVARPVHYIATKTFAAPALNPSPQAPAFTPPVAPVPPDKIVEETAAPAEEAAQAAPPSPAKPQAKPKTAPGAAPSPISGRQPALH